MLISLGLGFGVETKSFKPSKISICCACFYIILCLFFSIVHQFMFCRQAQLLDERERIKKSYSLPLTCTSPNTHSRWAQQHLLLPRVTTLIGIPNRIHNCSKLLPVDVAYHDRYSLPLTSARH